MEVEQKFDFDPLVCVEIMCQDTLGSFINDVKVLKLKTTTVLSYLRKSINCYNFCQSDFRENIVYIDVLF